MMTEAEADLEAWCVMHERKNSTAELIRLLAEMIDRLEEEADD